jgi:hypothetical protein
MFTLKTISSSGIPDAMAKAEQYRLLNYPVAAESICLDILEVDPDNQHALITLLLARTDQFHLSRGATVEQAREVLPRLASAYDRLYYAGLIAERRGRALILASGTGTSQRAYKWYREAMDHYQEAEALSPGNNDDAVLRWNTCARFLNSHPHLAPRDEVEQVHLLGE